MDVEVMPPRKKVRSAAAGQPVHKTTSILREHHFSGVASLTHCDNDSHAFLERQNGINPESIHSYVRAGIGQLLKVVDVRGISGMADDHTLEIDSLFAKDALLFEPPLRTGVSVSRDGNAGSAMRLSHGAQDSLDSGRDALLIGGAFEDRGLDAGVRYAVGDVSHEHFDHRLLAVKRSTRTTQEKVERNIAVGIDTGRHDDREIRFGGDALYARNVA